MPPYPEKSEVILTEGYYELTYRFSRYWRIEQSCRVPAASAFRMALPATEA
jgi:hypothetical protein